MKRVFVAIALLAAVVVLCVFSTAKLKSVLTEMDRTLERANELCLSGDYEGAASELERYHAQYEKSEKLFIAFLRRDYIYALKDGAATLLTYNNEETKYDMAAELARARECIAIALHSWTGLI